MRQLDRLDFWRELARGDGQMPVADAAFPSRLHGAHRAASGPGATIRRAGSGALGLADIAAGRVEADCELHINAGHCAAGIVPVHEAGGLANDYFAGDGIASGNPMIASNGALCAKLAEVIGIPPTNCLPEESCVS